MDRDEPTPEPSSPASEAPPAETLDFLLAQIVEAPERQFEIQQMLDGKVIQVFTGSGIVRGSPPSLRPQRFRMGRSGF